MNREKINNALQNEREKYLNYESTHDVHELESLYLRIADEIPEDKDSQPMVIAMEECGELSQAIAKGIRGKADVVNLAEEIADVQVIIDYVKIKWNLSDDDIKIIRALKLEQLEDIVVGLQTKYQSKLSPLNMMNAFTTLRSMTYDDFLTRYEDTKPSTVSSATIDYKCLTAGEFVDVHWRNTPQIIEDGLNVLKGTVKTMKIRARSIVTYLQEPDYDPYPSTDNALSIWHKILWAIYQIDTLIWVTAMVFRRFNIINAWTGDHDKEIINYPTLMEYGGRVYSIIHTLATRVDEFVDLCEYENITVEKSMNIRTVLNDALKSVTTFENEMFEPKDECRAEMATWLQLANLTEMMKRGDTDEERSV